MIVNISDDVCKNNGITKEEAFILGAIQYGTDEMYEHLIKEGYITKVNGSLFNLDKKFSITSKGINLLSDVILDSDKTLIENKDSIRELAIKLREVYPEGKMAGTSYYYRGNIADIEKKLKSFRKRYGTYSDKDIIEATKKYVASFNGNYIYLKLLKYFIWKDEVRDGEVVQVSMLADWIENAGQKSNLNSEWATNLR